jgi:two-component system, LytTR family, sensor kinase
MPITKEKVLPIFIYRTNMKKSFDIPLLVFYLVTALVYSMLWLIHDLSEFPFTFSQAFLNNLWRSIYNTVLNYLFLEYTLPFIIRKRKYIIYNIFLFFPILFMYCILWSYGLYGWRNLGIALHIYTPFIKTDASVLESMMSYSVGSVFFFGIARHIYNHVQLSRAAKRLRAEKQEAELNYLKSQTNPHFLFNTLNNIYSLSRDKSDLAPESILRLSKILRYMLYEAGGAYIAIEQELKIITDYIALEQLRYDESLHVNFNYDVEDMKQAVPPLLLIPLVENAFKHGVSETRGRPFVDIHLSIKNRQLTFIVKNSVEEVTEENTVKENIGLSNLRRQLELLYTDYNLSVQQASSVFTAILKINLASHV